jgi:hypothetical protein
MGKIIAQVVALKHPSKVLIGSKHIFDEEKIRKLNEEEFDRASNLP